MNTTTKTRRSFKFPKVDTVANAAMLAASFVGVCMIAVSAVVSVLGA